MFRIKICGITSADDALAAAAAGADAIGLNFYAQSPRSVDAAQARKIAGVLPEHTRSVGLFVNESHQRIRETAEQVGLDMVQLHGDESPEVLAALSGLDVIKAFRCAGAELAPIEAFLRECGRLGAPPAAALLDAFDPDKFGGTGKSLPWRELQTLGGSIGGVPLVLAGGLTPENVAAAIAAARPFAVDVSSGVERAAGQKDHPRMQAFVAAAKSAFGHLSAASGGGPGC